MQSKKLEGEEKMKDFAEFNIAPKFPMKGNKESITSLVGKRIAITDFEFIQPKDPRTGKPVDACQFQYHYIDQTVDRISFTRSKIIRKQLSQVTKDMLPFAATIQEKDRCLYLG